MRSLCLVLAGGLLAIAITTALSPCQAAGIGPELDGLGSFGLSLGAMRWLADEDAREYESGAAQIRPIGKAVFRYRMSHRWVVSVETGFGWNSYVDSDDTVLWVIPTTAGLERRVGELWGTTTYASMGAGFYIWGLRRDGNDLKDPVTFRTLHAVEPGVFAGLTGERYLAGHVTVSAQTSLHFMYSLHRDDFKGMLGGDDLFIDLRLGINYYFSPYEGLIWGGSEEQ